jgi:hypothetical protein
MDIDIRALKACSYAMSDDARHRAYLAGVCLEISPAGVLAIATDGHRLLAMAATEWDRTAGFVCHESKRDVIVPAAIIKRIKLNKRISTGTLSEHGDEWRIDYDNEIFTFKPVSGVYPTWRRVLPSHRELGAWAHFNPEYVSDFGKVAAIYGEQCAIVPNGESPAWVRFGDALPGVGVLMPMRNKITDIAPPVWCNWSPTLETAEAA